MSEITARDKELARAAWAHVEKDYHAAGLILFKELFTTFPDYIKFFERMKASKDQDIFESARFKKHMVSALFPSVALLLHNLDHPEELQAQLYDIGIKHKRRNVNRQNMEAIHKVIIFTLKTALGDLFTPETEAAWNKILFVGFDKISTVMEKIEL